MGLAPAVVAADLDYPPALRLHRSFLAGDTGVAGSLSETAFPHREMPENLETLRLS